MVSGDIGRVTRRSIYNTSASASSIRDLSSDLIPLMPLLANAKRWVRDMKPGSRNIKVLTVLGPEAKGGPCVQAKVTSWYTVA